MNDKEVKLAIQSAIKDFSKETLTDQAIHLFKTLGYNIERQNPFPQKSYNFFKESFLDSNSRFNQEKALVKEWKSIDLLFQLTRDEVSDQKSIFNTGKVKWEGEDKETVIETYLFFAIELIKTDYSRSALAQITREINKIFPMPVMLLFKYGEHLTLSVINRRLHKKDEQKDVLEKVTLIKDISIQNPHRAHIEILFDLSFEELKRVYKFTNFVELHNAWQKTLDTKELNKRFYRELSNWYFWAINNVSFPNDIDDDKDDTVFNSESIIRLLTRLIFIWFIKEKNLIPENIFDEKEVSKLIKGFKTKGSTVYYRTILQNLFFATLNQKIKERAFATDGTFEQNKKNYGIKNLYRYSSDFAISKDEVIKLFERVPFLNGGLFDCLDSEDKNGKVMYLDGFSRNPKKQAQVPDELFFSQEKTIDLSAVYDDKKKKNETVKGLFEIFNHYKFTITENTPIEEEVALDPELLGRVFENLLASYNPETKTTARKQTGSFYTPREIVNYMVDESLKAYLKQKLETESSMKPEDAEAGLVFLLGYNEKEHLFDEEQTSVLINAIDNCKILDPACGSGAFPMGILHKLVYILHKLDPQNKLWEERQLEKVDNLIKEAGNINDSVIRDKIIADLETNKKDIEESFAHNELDYGRKLYLIENGIYGVDIQPIATQISKLRFFISLIVDQKVNKNKDNFGIRPLPNLETKFVAANTLIGINKPGGLLRNIELDKLEKILKDIRHRLFSAKNPATKRKLREEDQKLREEMGKILEKSGWSNESAHQLAAWDPYNQNASSPFFDPEWMFGITEGFDVVIGNPPYLESRHPSFDKQLKALYQISCKMRWGDDVKYITRGADLLVYFFEISINLINSTGNIVLITQNAWLDTEYGIKIQEFLIKHTNVICIIDSKFRYFPAGEGPNINTVITQFFSKKPNIMNKIGFYILKRNIEDVFLEKSSNISKDNENYKVNFFSYSDDLLKKYKWGILHNSDTFLLDLIKILEKKAETIYKVPSNTKFSFGQGLNLSKSAYIPFHVLKKYKIDPSCCFPILYSGTPYQIRNTDWYIVRKSCIDKVTIKNLNEEGYSVFDENSTRKIPPVLIMPRGINKHFCSLNTISAYSLSGVDVYANDNKNIDKEVLNLWCFFNSSLFWLLREISGRKNLGGGLLKSEAADLNVFPVYLSLDINKTYFTNLFKREAMDTLIEISNEDHKIIDRIIFDYLGLSEKYRELCIEYLRNAVTLRSTRSIT